MRLSIYKSLAAVMTGLCILVPHVNAADLQGQDADTPVFSATDQTQFEHPFSSRYSLAGLDIDYSAIYLAEAEHQQPLLLASAMDTSGANTTDGDEFEPSMFTVNKVHQYLGVGAVVAGVITGIAPKKENGLHEYAAKTSAVLAISAVTTGLIYHWEDIGMDGGFDNPDNTHALLAGLGALGIAIAASEGPDSGHQGPGIAGLLAMVIGVKYTW